MTRGRLGALLPLLGLAMSYGSSPAARAQAEVDLAFVFLVPGVSFEEMLASVDLASLAVAGGAALMVPQGGLPTEPGAGFPGGEHVEARWLDAPLDEAAVTIRETVAAAGDRPVLVIVGSTTPSASMRGAKDEVHPLILATGIASELFAGTGEPRALTSDSTRRAGVVSDLDAPATIASSLGAERPNELGSTIRRLDEPAPFDLHRRYLAQRRMAVPVGAAAVAFLVLAGLAAVAFTIRGEHVSASWRRASGWASLSVAMLATGMLAAGHLPDLTYAAAIPMVAIVTVFGTMAFSPVERRDVTLVPAGIGAAVLAFFALEAFLGWRGMVTPLAGASQLDGARLFGLPNIAIGLLVGAGLWAVQRFSATVGVAVLGGIGLLAGMPFAGANLGGAVTAFAAAGMWLAVRERARLGAWRGPAVAAGTTVLGAVVVLVAHAVSPLPTHVSRVAGSADGLVGLLERYRERLEIGVDLLTSHPAALVPVLGIPVVLLVLLRPPAAIRATFERWPAWRDALLVTLLSGVVAYLANDTGAAAAGLAFALALGGMVGVSLLSGAGKMGSP